MHNKIFNIDIQQITVYISELYTHDFNAALLQ